MSPTPTKIRDPHDHENKAWMAVSGLTGAIGVMIAPEHTGVMVSMWGFLLVANLVLLKWRT